MALNPWDSLKKGANVSISGGGEIATISGGQHCVALTNGRLVSNGGKFLVEYLVPIDSLNASPMFGWANASQNFSATLGFLANGWSFWCDATPEKFHSGDQGGYGDDLTAKGGTVVLQMLADFDNVDPRFSFRWTLLSDPATIHDLGDCFGGLTGTLFPAFGCGNGGSEVSLTTINSTGPFIMAVPTGYLPFTSGNAADFLKLFR